MKKILAKDLKSGQVVLFLWGGMANYINHIVEVSSHGNVEGNALWTNDDRPVSELDAHTDYLDTQAKLYLLDCTKETFSINNYPELLV